jgi:hypothetical protein
MVYFKITVIIKIIYKFLVNLGLNKEKSKIRFKLKIILNFLVK